MMMHIKKASLADIKDLSVLFNNYRIFYGKSPDTAGAKKFLTERITKNESVTFLSRSSQGCATGFVQLYPIFSSTRMKRLWLLNDLFVSPEFRRTGTSNALMEAAKEFARETDSCGLVLETTKNNHVANKLYQRMGFTIDNDHNYFSWSE